MQDFDVIAVEDGVDGAGEVATAREGPPHFLRVAKELTGVKVRSMYSNSVSFLLVNPFR